MNLKTWFPSKNLCFGHRVVPLVEDGPPRRSVHSGPPSLKTQGVGDPRPLQRIRAHELDGPGQCSSPMKMVTWTMRLMGP